MRPEARRFNRARPLRLTVIGRYDNLLSVKTKCVRVGDVVFGADAIILVAGPCAVESADQLTATARAVAAAGGRVLRGGAFKPRTSPHSFQGLREEGLRILAAAKAETGLLLQTEITSTHQLDAFLTAGIDILQVGSRNMHNYELLKELAGVDMPVFLKRGFMATADELVQAAAYLADGGNERVVLCERGIRTFETRTRFTLDVGAVPALKTLAPWPVAVDPSHAAGRAEFVPPLAKAAVAAGADALLVEVHPDPPHALSDGRQSLDFAGFARCVEEVAALARAVGRTLG